MNDKKKVSLFILTSIISLNILSFDKVKLKREVRSFPLQGKDNAAVNLPSKDNVYKIFYFGFTSCPDICPMTLSKLKSKLRVKKLLDKVDVYLIDLDWKRDNGEQAYQYAQHFGKRFYGVSGTQKQIDDISKYYRAYYKFKDLPNSALKYTIDHSSFIYLISPKNKLLKITPSDQKLDPIVDLIK